MHNRRKFLTHSAGLMSAVTMESLLPAWARNGSIGIAPTLPTVSGDTIDLRIGRTSLTLGGKPNQAITINGVLPGPLVRLQEGRNVRILVHNGLDEETSIHWHGLIVPFQMDGVPGVSFPGIPPRQTFAYEFPVRQYGTYWYHSHSGLQEQLGHYGPIIIDPVSTDPVAYDREHVLVLSDWSAMNPHTVMNQLKQEPGHFNRNNLSLLGLFGNDPAQNMSLEDRVEWARMRMDPTDIADVTGAIYSYLINGHGANENWTGIFRPGERVRLRVINASAMTAFNFRIPGLDMTVVNADGENVRPVTVSEFLISVAETYDVIVRPRADKAYSIIAESVDRSGLGRATLAPRMGMTAAVPPLRPRPLLGMEDMGMDMNAMDMGGMNMGGTGGMPEMGGKPMAGMTKSGMAKAAMNKGGMGGMSGMGGKSMPGMAKDAGENSRTMNSMKPGNMSGGMMEMDMRDPSNAPPNVDVGVGVDLVTPMPQDRTGHPGLGLTNVGHKVLTYRDLIALKPNPDSRAPTRKIQIFLTGNMRRFMWSLDGRQFSEGVEPIRLARNERVRVTIINSSMMQHPMHLHGHFMELVNGHSGRHPRKHTINVLPGSKITFDLTADNPGDWAFHCHLLLHMHAGMFNVVTVRPLVGERS